MIKLKPKSVDADEEDEKVKEKRGLVRKNIIKVNLGISWEYKIKMMGFQKKIRDISVTLRFVFVALSDQVVTVDFGEWVMADAYDIQSNWLVQNDTHVFGVDLLSQIYTEIETFGALDGKHQAGLIYKDKTVDVEKAHICVNNKHGVSIMKGREDDEWEVLRIELFSRTTCY